MLWMKIKSLLDGYILHHLLGSINLSRKRHRQIFTTTSPTPLICQPTTLALQSRRQWCRESRCPCVISKPPYAEERASTPLRTAQLESQGSICHYATSAASHSSHPRRTEIFLHTGGNTDHNHIDLMLCAYCQTWRWNCRFALQCE